LAVTWLIVGFGYFGKHVAREDHANIHWFLNFLYQSQQIVIN
jgi:hypothetical protein